MGCQITSYHYYYYYYYYCAHVPGSPFDLTRTSHTYDKHKTLCTHRIRLGLFTFLKTHANTRKRIDMAATAHTPGCVQITATTPNDQTDQQNAQNETARKETVATVQYESSMLNSLAALGLGLNDEITAEHVDKLSGTVLDAIMLTKYSKSFQGTLTERRDSIKRFLQTNITTELLNI